MWVRSYLIIETFWRLLRISTNGSHKEYERGGTGGDDTGVGVEVGGDATMTWGRDGGCEARVLLSLDDDGQGLRDRRRCRWGAR